MAGVAVTFPREAHVHYGAPGIIFRRILVFLRERCSPANYEQVSDQARLHGIKFMGNSSLSIRRLPERVFDTWI